MFDTCSHYKIGKGSFTFQKQVHSQSDNDLIQPSDHDQPLLMDLQPIVVTQQSANIPTQPHNNDYSSLLNSTTELPFSSVH